ncbi:MAG: hypothetical protein WCE90_03150 [Candidatus Zixiibacteriota bacterium]
MNNINEIIAKDKVLGDLARESKECADENKYMTALACLFLLVEHAINGVLDRSDGSFSQLTREAKEKGLITEDEFIFIEKLRNLRNKLFHKNHYAWHMEIKGILCQFSEDQARKIILEELCDGCYQIVKKLI